MNFSLPFTRRSAQLPPDTAEQILSNVFTACKREPNSVPLEALTSYSNSRKERYALQRSLILLMLALFMLLPLLFLAASVTVMQVNPGSEENPVYAISVDTRIPIRQVEARLAGQTGPSGGYGCAHAPVYRNRRGQGQLLRGRHGQRRRLRGRHPDR